MTEMVTIASQLHSGGLVLRVLKYPEPELYGLDVDGVLVHYGVYASSDLAKADGANLLQTKGHRCSPACSSTWV